jgi:hypothetical protein
MEWMDISEKVPVNGHSASMGRVFIISCNVNTEETACRGKGSKPVQTRLYAYYSIKWGRSWRLTIKKRGVEPVHPGERFLSEQTCSYG